MLNFSRLKQYRENNRIEAKKAVGGFPKSVWETYSAFANTIGGLILLGVEEAPDKSLHAVDLPSPQRLADEFWETVNDKEKVSANILSPKDVRIVKAEGKSILRIHVPRAQRKDRPVYLDKNPYTGTYRRNGEGDYRCKAEEVDAMLRDAKTQSADEKTLLSLSFEAFDPESVRDYPASPLDVGAGERDNAGELRPTVGGLLFFGKWEWIRQEFPHFRPVLIDNGDTYAPQGNLFSFYRGVRDVISHKVPAPLRAAACEALLNCLVNADYFSTEQILIELGETEMKFSNPGLFRLDLKSAYCGGISDPRNLRLTQLFHAIRIGKRTGSGIPMIFSVCRDKNLPEPSIVESFNPARTTLILPLKKSAAAHKSAFSGRDALRKEELIRVLTDHAFGTCSNLSQILKISTSAVRRLLSQLEREQLVVSKGKRPKLYFLKS